VEVAPVQRTSVLRPVLSSAATARRASRSLSKSSEPRAALSGYSPGTPLLTRELQEHLVPFVRGGTEARHVDSERNRLGRVKPSHERTPSKPPLSSTSSISPSVLGQSRPDRRASRSRRADGVPLQRPAYLHPLTCPLLLLPEGETPLVEREGEKESVRSITTPCWLPAAFPRFARMASTRHSWN